MEAKLSLGEKCAITIVMCILKVKNLISIGLMEKLMTILAWHGVQINQVSKFVKFNFSKILCVEPVLNHSMMPSKQDAFKNITLITCKVREYTIMCTNSKDLLHHQKIATCCLQLSSKQHAWNKSFNFERCSFNLKL